jgi:hypothetical protein
MMTVLSYDIEARCAFSEVTDGRSKAFGHVIVEVLCV